MIGTKTLGIGALLAVVVVAAAALGTFAPARLAARGFESLLLVGAFGIVVGTSMFRFWRLGEKSGHYFRTASEASTWDVSEAHFVGGDRLRVVVGENRDGEAYDWSPRARHVASVAVASVLALAASDARALEKLAHASDGALSMASSYCPDEAPAPAETRDVNEPGCELVRRAYALGYAKTLGECAPKTESADADARAAVCTRRQRDEPLLHYSWRHLATFFGGLRDSTRVGVFKRAREDFRARTGHLASLRSAEKEVLTSAPHAAHHVWTNLPDPKDGAFESTTCTNRYLRLPHRPTPPAGGARASKVFEHVFAQLLFDATYDDAAGHCREYHVHWGAPLDACKRLAANPAAFLTESGAIESVRATLERYRVATDLAALGGAKPSAEPSSFVSFGCYFEGGPSAASAASGAAVPPGDASERASTPFTFAGARFTADELRVPPSPEGAAVFVDRYDAVARLLVAGFHYGTLLSEAGLEPGSSAGLEGAFREPDFLVTRLYELDAIDLYLDPGWVVNRPDLLEVYPYERHLKNYVEVFRRQYRRTRGRL